MSQLFMWDLSESCVMWEKSQLGLGRCLSFVTVAAYIMTRIDRIRSKVLSQEPLLYYTCQ